MEIESGEGNQEIERDTTKGQDVLDGRDVLDG
jgi:hypothetical protein